jgi:hypothetical protein
MIITEENQFFFLQAMKVDFLTERWEREWYTLAVMRAAAWGKKIDRQNKEYYSKNRMIDKYNV